MSEKSQQNLWGSVGGLEAQRVDLWQVDMNSAIARLQSVVGIQLPPILPQYVQSVTLPEVRMKAEAFRRDSVAYNMPSWDDPLDAVKIVFIMDTTGNVNESAVVQMLEAWTTLVRAGRGSRRTGYFSAANAPTLDNDYRIDFMFDFTVKLLRGSIVTPGVPSQTSVTRQLANANRAALANQQNLQLLQRNTAPSTLSTRSTSATGAEGSSNRDVFSALEVAADYRLTGAWLAGYKIAELTYGNSGVLTIDTTFYVDSIDRDDVPSSRIVTVQPAP